MSALVIKISIIVIYNEINLDIGIYSNTNAKRDGGNIQASLIVIRYSPQCPWQTIQGDPLLILSILGRPSDPRAICDKPHGVGNNRDR